ncbi:MAG: hypothetical protein ACYTFI_13545 [Planctomycetota bacterium]|jgi:hypothetical protein
MRTFRTITAGGWASALVLGLALTGCDRAPSSSTSTPGAPGDGTGGAAGEVGKASGAASEGLKAAFKSLKASLGAGDFGAVYDMMSADARAKAGAKLKAAAGSASAMGPMAKAALGFDPGELAKLPAREAYTRMMKGAHEAGVKLDRSVGGGDSGLAGAAFVKAKTKGDAATVTAALPSGAKREIKLVREGGAWKLAETLISGGAE